MRDDSFGIGRCVVSLVVIDADDTNVGRSIRP